jgi:hypothetical protein
LPELDFIVLSLTDSMLVVAAPIARGGEVTFTAVAGHDSKFIVLTPQ